MLPRLDVWLVEEGLFSSRQAAKRAIRAGLVTVNGTQVKPSKQVSGQEEILVSSEARDFPQGYTKLQQIDNEIEENIVEENILALDIGSSAGGFLVYLEEKGAQVIGLEISATFIPRLQEYAESSDRVSIVEGDAFTLDPLRICDIETLDLLLVDVTTEIEGTIKLIQRYLPLLKKGGRLIAAFKSQLNDEILSSILVDLKSNFQTDVKTIVLESSRQEFHLVAKRH